MIRINRIDIGKEFIIFGSMKPIEVVLEKINHSGIIAEFVFRATKFGSTMMIDNHQDILRSNKKLKMLIENYWSAYYEELEYFGMREKDRTGYLSYKHFMHWVKFKGFDTIK